MNDGVPSVTVLIAARPGQAEVKAAAAARRLDYPPAKLEILLARGRQPSAQRNAGMKAARGQLVYFLDDDSVAQPENLRRAIAHFADPQVQMVGGPNLCPPDAPELEQIFALALASRLAFGPSRARYCPVGRSRVTSEKELILCNLVARRETMLAMGGFNEALYPNEENALMDELQNRGGKLVYDPDCYVYRRPRPSLRAFARMLMTYGRGRAEQFRLHPTFGSALNFAPPLFLVYVLATAACLIGFPWIGKLLLVPLVGYALAVTLEAGFLAATHPGGMPRPASGHAAAPRLGLGARAWRGLCVIPLIALTHLLYGFGFWRGLFTPLKPAEQRAPVPVDLESVSLPASGASQ